MLAGFFIAQNTYPAEWWLIMTESSLSEDQVSNIAKRVADELVEKRRAQWIDPETHHHHHEWVEGRLESERERKQLVNKIILSACIWAIPLILIWVASSFWESFINALRAGLQ